MKGKEIKRIDDISFKDFYVILVLSTNYNIECKSTLRIFLGSQNTPLKEIKPSLAINTDLDASQPESERSVEIDKKEFSIPQDSSASKIEYKALLPQYKEFSSESETSKPKEVKPSAKDHTLSTKKSLSEDPHIIISRSVL